MVRILVTPEQLFDLSRQMNLSAAQLRDLEGQLARSISVLDWQTRRQANIEGQVQSARQHARYLADRAEAMARFLNGRAQAFQEADQGGSQNISRISETFSSLFTPLMAPRVPADRIKSNLLLGTLFSGLSVDAVFTRLPKTAETVTWTNDLIRLTRTEFRGGLRSIGRWLNTVTFSRHGGWVKRMESLTGIVPVRDARRIRLPEWFTSPTTGTALDAGLDFIANKDYTWHGAAAAGLSAVGTTLLIQTVPGVGTILFFSSLIQVGGNLGMWGLDALGQKEWAERGRRFLELIDAHKYIYSAASSIVDGVTSPWNEPKTQRIMRLGNICASGG